MPEGRVLFVTSPEAEAKSFPVPVHIPFGDPVFVQFLQVPPEKIGQGSARGVETGQALLELTQKVLIRHIVQVVLVVPGRMAD